jgi:hypothetical protein
VKLVLSAACPELAEAVRAAKGVVKWGEWICGVNIGKNFRQFSTKSAGTLGQKLKFSKIFNLLSQIELRAASHEKRLYFRIKSAGSSNYRGNTFFASGKKTNIKSLSGIFLGPADPDN